MSFFEIMKYLARAIEQMRAVDGILILQFPWPNDLKSGTRSYTHALENFRMLLLMFLVCCYESKCECKDSRVSVRFHSQQISV